MSVKFNGLKKLNVNVFDEITISQYDVYDYVVNVLGDRIDTVYNEFSKEISDMSGEDIIFTVIERFLGNFRINGITDLIKLHCKDGKWIVVYGNNGSKTLNLQLFNPIFKEILKNIKDKYINDRYQFCWKEDVKLVKLFLDPTTSRYDSLVKYCDECEIEQFCSKSLEVESEKCINLSLMFDKDRNVLGFEKKFIKEFLYYKFSSIGEDVKIYSNYFDSNWRIINGYILRCGDFRVYFSDTDSFMFLFDIVSEYNRELFEIKENVKKKQLKMEGF